MIVVGGSASKQLAVEVARELGVKMAQPEVRKFPDLETYVRIHEDLKGRDVVLVQNGFPDDKIIEMFLLQDAIYENGAEKLITVIPYYGYSRQDKLFNPGEAVSARCLAGHFQDDTDSVIMVDLHTDKILDWFDVDTRHVTAMKQIGEYLKNKGTDLIISPDKGGIERAKVAAIAAECEFDALDKKRIDSHTVEMQPLKTDVTGLNVAIVDDIISTGGTIATAATQLTEKGARRVTAACTHGLFIGNAINNLQSVCAEVISTDTIQNPTTHVSVAPEIAIAIKELVG